ncbi:MAG TPA: PQQ-binding-like beta-propeller repeat protein [Verrucomicrobiae bacterium]|jgi:outer membrane protein assembly factor BamB|nr:PQQ-binding-like beta-propeller repeat protein [Verrucomicrobiae bacterium]
MKWRFALWFVAVAIVPGSLRADNWPQWRGPQRDGISHETGLLGEWPREGPGLLWKADDIGRGYSTPAVVGDRLFMMANEGLDNEFAEALDAASGKRVWSTRIGKVGNPEQQPNFPAARSTPTVDGDALYVLSSDGDLACLESKTGHIRWQKNLRAEFGGKPGVWAYAESPLVDGGAVVCAPGGSEATVVALHKDTGELIWKCAVPEGDDAAFSSTIVVEADGLRQYVRLLTKGLVGIEAKSGRLLWRYSKPISRYAANIQTPLASGDYIFCSATGTGAGLIKLKADGSKIEPEQIYFKADSPTAIGGVVKVGDYLYGTTADALLCADFQTGQTRWKERSLGAASLCYAEGRLYLHGENGEVALVEATPEGYHEKGRFTPSGEPSHPNQMEKAWAYPVVANGHLYIRDHGDLWCYAVKAPTGQ